MLPDLGKEYCRIHAFGERMYNRNIAKELGKFILDICVCVCVCVCMYIILQQNNFIAQKTE